MKVLILAAGLATAMAAAASLSTVVPFDAGPEVASPEQLLITPAVIVIQAAPQPSYDADALEALAFAAGAPFSVLQGSYVTPQFAPLGSKSKHTATNYDVAPAKASDTNEARSPG